MCAAIYCLRQNNRAYPATFLEAGTTNNGFVDFLKQLVQDAAVSNTVTRYALLGGQQTGTPADRKSNWKWCVVRRACARRVRAARLGGACSWQWSWRIMLPLDGGRGCCVACRYDAASNPATNIPGLFDDEEPG
jgi:hypothetical protein